ncbi:malonate decarboxylase holo-[acyl-carrier-protein] synthase [Pseudoduganella sp. FT26W]|uniref:Malonate decarboxylase holo-[acyl-carrier-protein] synthase n=2 Tax=Duganella aquatilis TaxID=2666082 RepID=A0A844DE21_9BURK|nr:malonate decarboxylase holo-[acyl-carrier-protein] synthase [Duganella aquatilis]
MLVWLTAAGWHAAIAAARDEHRTALALWESQDWPVVVRRLEADVEADEICLGLPLPPHAETGHKVRIGLRARVADIRKTAPAVALRSAGEHFAALCDEAGALQLRVYGSLAMQTLTGLQYVSPASDVDVLFHPASRDQLAAGVALLARHGERLPLDGEIVFPGGAAVSWKEWRMAMAHPAKVMVKELQSVRLADTASLLATLEPA